MKGPWLRFWNANGHVGNVRYYRLADLMGWRDRDEYMTTHRQAAAKRARKQQYKQAGRAPVGGWTR